GASPGASTAVHVMLDVIERCFPEQVNEWEAKIKEMVPSYVKQLMENPEPLEEVKASSSEALGLDEKPAAVHSLFYRKRGLPMGKPRFFNDREEGKVNLCLPYVLDNLVYPALVHPVLQKTPFATVRTLRNLFLL